MTDKNWNNLQNPILLKTKSGALLMWRAGLSGGILCFFLMGWAFLAKAYSPQSVYTASRVPEELKGLEVEEKTGAFIDKELSFTDEKDQAVRLKKYFKSGRPVLLSIVYYGCPNLCTLHLNGLAEGLQPLSSTFKKQIEWIVLSMDHKENSALAQAKKNKYVKKYLLPPHRVHFLTGTKENILSLSQQVGFRFRWDDSQKIYAHIPVAYVLTAEAQISRYLYGVQFITQTLKLSLVEASLGHIGRLVDRVLLFCFQFDPKKGRYSWYAYNVMRAGGALTVVLLFSFLLPIWIKENRKDKKKGHVT